MADPFTAALARLMESCPSLAGASFADLDGQDIALAPSSERDTLRLCAAYGGIALRRLNSAEAEAGRGVVRRVVLSGTRGRFAALKVADEYQLVLALAADAPLGRILSVAQGTVAEIEAAI